MVDLSIQVLDLNIDFNLFNLVSATRHREAVYRYGSGS